MLGKMAAFQIGSRAGRLRCVGRCRYSSVGGLWCGHAFGVATCSVEDRQWHVDGTAGQIASIKEFREGEQIDCWQYACINVSPRAASFAVVAEELRKTVHASSSSGHVTALAAGSVNLDPAEVSKTIVSDSTPAVVTDVVATAAASGPGTGTVSGTPAVIAPPRGSDLINWQDPQALGRALTASP